MEQRAATQGRPVRHRGADAVRPFRQLTDESPIVLVDGENVRRSRWPNLSREELVERCCAWAIENDVHALVVFDGGHPDERRAGDRCTVAGSGGETADDWLVRRVAELHEAERRYWLVTSDRALREAAGGEAERTFGGGAFLRELTPP